jgi:hypothetical protein
MKLLAWALIILTGVARTEQRDNKDAYLTEEGSLRRQLPASQEERPSKNHLTA